MNFKKNNAEEHTYEANSKIITDKPERTNYLAFAILGVMALLMVFSSIGDSAIMDELAHIPAGYSYLTQKDYRLNPEHPPLIKDLAAVPALFLGLNFPTDTKAWREDINGQWTQGEIFLYESGNNPDSILFWMRLPEMLLALLFGWLFFRWTKKNFGYLAAILALTFYAFSPTFIAHSRFVTTDLAAAFAFFIGIVSFISFLESPTRKNMLITGLLFGVAELLKFSLFLLLPIYAILLVMWVIVQNADLNEKLRLFTKLAGKTILIGLIGTILIWAVYGYHVWNYPPERQLHDAEYTLSSFGNRQLVNIDLWMIKQPVFRPLGQYFMGILMVVQRVAGGNTNYFLGEVSSGGSRLYFPTMYLLKEPLAFHILSLIALIFAARKILRVRQKSIEKTFSWMRGNYITVSAWVFIIFYWGYSMRAPLNIGVRHLLPTFTFIYLLVSKGLSGWLSNVKNADPRTWHGWIKNIYELYIKSVPKYLLLGVLLVWLIADTIVTYPHFLSYYNELAGGTDNGYKYAVDSNYDWGQDLKRLKEFTEKNGIKKIAVDYFGGGSPKYYLGNKFEPWWSAKGPAHGWFAISSTFQMSALGKPVPGFVQKPEDSYEWLKNYQPVARTGKSIFIYQLP
ncbi:MAG: glycosyltransferase family 39 protein [bacterium]|nr:glycosyltransferase family 39 protein [bacterium]